MGMNSERRVQLRREAKAAWARKTPEEKKASMNGLAAEIGENAAMALRDAFEKAFAKEAPEADDNATAEQRRG
jgi:hypothetical protein